MTNIEVQTEAFAMVLAQTQDNELLQTQNVLETTANYFDAVSTLVEGLVNNNQPISPMV